MRAGCESWSWRSKDGGLEGRRAGRQKPDSLIFKNNGLVITNKKEDEKVDGSRKHIMTRLPDTDKVTLMTFAGKYKYLTVTGFHSGRVSARL